MVWSPPIHSTPQPLTLSPLHVYYPSLPTENVAAALDISAQLGVISTDLKAVNTSIFELCEQFNEEVPHDIVDMFVEIVDVIKDAQDAIDEGECDIRTDSSRRIIV